MPHRDSPGWVLMLLGVYAWGEIAFGALYPSRLTFSLCTTLVTYALKPAKVGVGTIGLTVSGIFYCDFCSYFILCLRAAGTLLGGVMLFIVALWVA